MKKCSSCKEEKSRDNFNKQSHNLDRLDYACKKCSRVKSKKWRENNIEKTKARIKRWREINPEKDKTSTKKWRENNPHKGATYESKRRALKKGVIENYTTEDRAITLNVFSNQCFLCKTADNLCIDHHRPLSKENPLTLSNAVVLCFSCNSSKKDKNPEDFYGLKVCSKLDNLLFAIGAIYEKK